MQKRWLAALVLLFALLLSPLSNVELSGRDSEKHATGNVLLLTAHPDDECMFFAPTILALVTSGAKVHSLCLSVGNADGLGEVRRHELAGSLDVLGIPAGQRWVVDRPDLQDNITLDWDPRIISSVIEPYIRTHDISTIITFDASGISNHPNHRALPRGAAHLLSHAASLSPRPRLLALITVPLHEKYIGPLAPLLSKAAIHLRRLVQCRLGAEEVDTSPLPAPLAFVAGVREFATAHRAMRAHWSQLVWFRWLYVLFSRYMWVNELVEIDVMAAA